MTGYYAAYYTNGGKKAKSPNELIKKLYATKQSFEDGLRDIEKLKEIEKARENGKSFRNITIAPKNAGCYGSFF